VLVLNRASALGHGGARTSSRRTDWQTGRLAIRPKQVKALEEIFVRAWGCSGTDHENDSQRHRRTAFRGPGGVLAR
jgi:hypothetical protein